MFDTDKFVEDCKRALADDESHKAVREVVAEAVSDPGAIVKSLGAPTEAGFTPLYHTDDLKFTSGDRSMLIPCKRALADDESHKAREVVKRFPTGAM